MTGTGRLPSFSQILYKNYMYFHFRESMGSDSLLSHKLLNQAQLLNIR